MSWPARSRRYARNAAILAALLTSAMLASCGGGSVGPTVVHNAGTPKGNYMLTVTATYTSGSTTVTHNIPLTLTVN